MGYDGYGAVLEDQSHPQENDSLTPSHGGAVVGRTEELMALIDKLFLGWF